MGDPSTATPSAALRREDALALHIARTVDELREQLRGELARLAPGSRAAVLLAEDSTNSSRVAVAVGVDCPVEEGSVVETHALAAADGVRLPLEYRGHSIGELWLEPPPLDTNPLQDLAAHFAVARVNLKFNADAQQSSEHYFASLLAFEEGVVLFQESDKEAVSARFLSLVTSALAAQFGALYLLEQPGDPESGLRLDQALGIPEHMLEELCDADGAWWPNKVVQEPPQVLVRGVDGVFPVLDDTRVPAPLSSLVTCPLSFHGLNVGIALVLNADSTMPSFSSKVESVRRLGELGAALFHRMRLEELAVRSQEVETQLAIASKIQARLMPTAAPQCAAVQCAWSSQPAQKIGGDYVDLLTDSDTGGVFAVIADVSGHGVNSALLMTSFRATCRAEAFRRSPDQLLAKLNHEIVHETGDTGMFVTAAVFRIAPDGRSGCYASAGHNDVLLYRAQRDEVELLESTGPSTGFFAGVDYDAASLQLSPGDVLVLYTDGIVEATKPGSDFDMFGDARLHECVRAAATSGPRQVLDAILAALTDFAGDCSREDDVSVSVIQIV